MGVCYKERNGALYLASWPCLPLPPAVSVPNTSAAMALSFRAAALLLGSVSTSPCPHTNTLQASLCRHIPWWNKMYSFYKATPFWFISWFFRSFFQQQKDTSLDVCHCVTAGILQNNPDPASAPGLKEFLTRPVLVRSEYRRKELRFPGCFYIAGSNPTEPSPFIYMWLL